MSLPIPLGVTLQTSRRTMRVTRQVRDLSLRSTSPGGFASASIQLDRPIALQPDELAYYARLVICDGRHSGIVFDGRVEDMGRGAGADGQVWDIVAMGPAAHAHDRTVPYIAVDSSMERWERSTGSSRTSAISQGEYSDDVPGWILQAPEGTVCPTSWVADIVYRAIRNTGGKIGRAKARVDNGGASVDWSDDMTTGIGTPTTFVHRVDWTGAILTLNAQRGGTIPADHDIVTLRITRTGASTVATNNVWGHFIDIVVLATLKDKAGSDVSTSLYGNNWFLAHWIVEDLLGRYLTRYDGANARVDAATYHIDQLAYPDGADQAKVLDDLMILEPAFTWHAWEQNPANGKHRFEWVSWPTTVRYDARAVDGFVSPSSADGLYNRVTVRYRSPDQTIRSLTRTQTVPELTDAGFDRQAFIDLGDEIGSATNAAQAGDQWLVDHMAPPNEGTLTVARPILDRYQGRMVAPWEILPGQLIRVRGVQPRVDALNPTTRDGVTVFRIKSVEYRSAAGAATLELDTYSQTTMRALAKLRTPITRRR
jgi:hypothetical protein